MELEKDNFFAFFDTYIFRALNQILKVVWYHKPTFSERFIDYFSQHCFKHKVYIIRHLKIRAVTISCIEYHNKNIELIKSFLINNNYPIFLVIKIFNETRQPSIKTSNLKYFNIRYEPYSL